MAKSKRENMVEPGYWNGVVDGVAGDSSFDDVVGLFESMEGLDEDNVSVDAEDWDAQFQNLGPIPSEVLQGFGHVSAANIGYNMQRVWPDKCVPDHRTYEVKQLPDNDVSDGVEVSSDSSRAEGARLFHAQSPISVLQSSGSYSTEKKIPTGHELLIPVRTRSKRLRPPALCKWHLISPIVPSKMILNTKRKETNRKNLPPLLPEESEVNENQKRCTHCQATQTPLWRKGPMGIGTLCNACGVKYRCQGVLPAYRFRPWPTAGKEKKKLPQLPKDPEDVGNHQHLHNKRCTYCQVTESLEWRDGPMGSGTLCKACGQQYQSGHFPENRPSPTVEKKIKKRPQLPEDLAVKKTDPHMQSKRCTHCQVSESPEWRDGPMGSGILCNACGVQYQSGHLPESCPSPTVEKKIKKRPQLPEDLAVKKIDPHMQSKRCTHCQVTESPEWKDGPMGSGALCNACGVQYQSGNLLPEYLPSPTVEKKRKKSRRLPEDLDVKENHRHLHNKRCTLCNGCEVQHQLSDFLPECRRSPTVEKKRKKRPRLTEYLVVTENHQHRHDKRCTHCQVMETPEWRDGPMGSETLCNTCGDQYQLGHLLPDYRPSPVDERKKSQLLEGLGVKESHQRINSRKCTHCQVTQTPQWREGPMGPKTLCNACGVRYKKGRLLPEYRPLASPTFVPSLHSNSHKKVLQMRNELIQISSLPERNPAVDPWNPQESSVPMMNPALCPPPGPIPIYALQSQMRNEVVQEHFVPEMTLAMSPLPEPFPVNAMHMRNEVVLESGVPKMEPAMSPPPEFVPTNSYLYYLIQE